MSVRSESIVADLNESLSKPAPSNSPTATEARARIIAAAQSPRGLLHQRIPAMIAIMIANGGGDAQGSQRGLEYDTLLGRFAEFIQAEVLPRVEEHCAVKLTSDPEDRHRRDDASYWRM